MNEQAQISKEIAEVRALATEEGSECSEMIESMLSWQPKKCFNTNR